MNREPVAPATGADARQLGRRAMWLGAASTFDYAVQFLLPVVLVRCLDPEAFGQYRLLWLVIGTVMSVVTLAVPGSLYYYLPRSEGAMKRLYINQTLLVHVVAGIVAGWAVSEWNPWLPAKLREVTGGVAVPAFVLLWVVAAILDLLPTVEERIRWQAKAIIGLAAIRALSLTLAAVIWRELTPVVWAMLAFVVVRMALLVGYIAKYHGLRGPVLRLPAFASLLKLSLPFWASGALYSLRAQADQWVAAALFSLSAFAAFSIAGVLAPLVNLFRLSVNNAFLPAMSKLEAAGDNAAMLELNSRANVIVGALIFPLFALAFVFAEDIVSIIYTAHYVGAAPVMRIYIVGLAAMVIELGSVTLLLRQGAFMMGLNLVTLFVSAVLNWFGAHAIGLPGAAVGTVIAMYVDRMATLHRIARRTGTPLRHLQDWPALGFLLLAAVLAAALAWGVVGRFLAATGPMLQVIAGGSLLIATYAGLGTLFGHRRGWLSLARGS